MHLNSLVKSSPLRLALIFSALFFVCFFVAGTVAYRVLLKAIEERLDRSIVETSTLIGATYNVDELEDFTHTVDSYVASTPDHERIFLALDASGRRLAGNFETVDIPVGISTLSSSYLGLDSDSDFRVMSRRIGTVRLVVGASLADTDEFNALTVRSLAWAGGIASAVSIVLGAMFAGLAQRRMKAIAETMERVGHGDLDARVPIPFRDDDIGLLSGQINVALDRLSKLVEGMRQVSVDIAHDLKTPLNRMSITIERSLELAERGEPNCHELTYAQQVVAQINGTFEALLRIAQLEAGDRRERFRALDIDQLVISIVDIYQDVAEDAGMTLTLQNPDPELKRIVGDADLLTQLLSNLIENSIRHAAGGDAIEVKVERRGDKISVAVADNGPGIPPEERSRVFQRLYRLEKSRTTPGSGLGLSMVKAIADLHGAAVALTDHGPGLVVFLRFPVAEN